MNFECPCFFAFAFAFALVYWLPWETFLIYIREIIRDMYCMYKCNRVEVLYSTLYSLYAHMETTSSRSLVGIWIYSTLYMAWQPWASS